MSQVRAFIAGMVFIGLGIFFGDPVPQEFSGNAGGGDMIAEDVHKEAGSKLSTAPMYTEPGLSVCAAASDMFVAHCL